MSNKIETVSIGDLPIATEPDDADELLLRDASAALPENATARLSIATLRAAMGSPDRIESASGDAFVEASEFNGSPRTIARSGVGQGYAIQATFSDGDKSSSEMIVKGDGSPSAGIRAEFDEGVYTLSAHGAPLEIEEPTEGQHAATKGYVDARPGAEEWSEHAATQDVDLDGNKLTGLGAPTDEDDAATKGYVDGAAPAKIERTFAWGRSVAEVTDDGNIELAVYRTGQADPVRRVRVHRGNSGGQISLMNRDYGLGFVSMLSVGTTSPSLTYAVTDGPGGGASERGGLSFNAGRWHFTEQNGSQIPLGSPGYYTLPAGVGSIKHGVHLAKEAYDTLASMPAPPELEWWEPVWTAVSNVDSVSNVECSYTRAYRAAGGSLVTLEGTVTIESLGAGTCVLEAGVPVPRDGSDRVYGIATIVGADTAAGIVSVTNGDLMIYAEASGADELSVAFRISYRAA